MIITSVKVQELFVGQIRNILRIAAGLVGIGGIRIKGIQDLPLQHALRRGKGSLHLVVNHAIQGQFAFRSLHLIVPALLTEDLFFLINIRIEHCVHVYMNQVLKILVIAACNGIYGFIRVGHGIQKGIQGTLCQLHKRILHWEFPGAAEHRMFQNMGHARVVRRRGPKSDVKHLIHIVIG